LTLVERSAEARAGQARTLAPHASRVREMAEDLPAECCGIIFCNELLDAMPVHVVVMTEGGLAEVYVDLEGGQLVERLGPPSSPAVAEYFAFTGVALQPGARAEAHLAGRAWIRQAAAILTRGSLVIIDYGHEAAQLYSSPHATGTLRTFHRHVADASDAVEPGVPAWLVEPGSRDLTTHVDLTAIRREAERCGLVTVADTDQSRFLLAAAERSGLLADLEAPDRLADRLAMKTLLVPEGMGTTHRVLVAARRAPALSTRREGA
jgi:SAM-dependent MidA family methyltransferase